MHAFAWVVALVALALVGCAQQQRSQMATDAKARLVDVVMTDGQVSRLNYSGPSGGPLTPTEQCGFAVQNCVK